MQHNNSLAAMSQPGMAQPSSLQQMSAQPGPPMAPQGQPMAQPAQPDGDQMAQLQQQIGISPDNAQQVLQLAAQALQNPASYPQFVEQAKAVGLAITPPTFDERFLKIISAIAQKALGGQGQPQGQPQGGSLEQMAAQPNMAQQGR